MSDKENVSPTITSTSNSITTSTKTSSSSTTTTNKDVFFNIPKWLEDNKAEFKPPVCNYMMHGEGRLKVMFVGGPNIRKDFHLEEGEEFFYMDRGDMTLVVLERGQFKDVHIKEGEVFQLPGKILHSPQRFPDTMGLVIERERLPEEMDCVRYFVEGTTDTLYEEWFYCADLGTQLGPVIKRYFASEQHKTGKPIPGSVTSTPPFLADSVRPLEKPFHLLAWVNKHMKQIQSEGSRRLWGPLYQSDVLALGEGECKKKEGREGETWLWQLVGTSTVTVQDGPPTKLGPQDSILVKPSEAFTHVRSAGSVCLSVSMALDTKDRAFQHLKTPATSALQENGDATTVDAK